MPKMDNCIICGKSNGRNKYCCSHKCYSLFRQHFRVCEVCGNPFPCPPSNQVKTCGPECSAKMRAFLPSTHANVKKAIDAARISPLSGPFETNAVAKTWEIQSPDGEKYHVRNLALWAREHDELLPSSPAQFCQGIRDIKRTYLGKKKRGSSQYKGWILIEWKDE